MRIVRNFTVREFFVFETLFVNGELLTIDELFVRINMLCAMENPACRIVRKGKNVYFEQEMDPNVYANIKDLMDGNPEYLRTIVEDEFIIPFELFHLIKGKGYRFALSIKCGNNQPIIINIDL